MIIAIDGHSSCGKSTIAKQLAKELSIAYIDTGAMYRCVTLYALRHGMINNATVNTNAIIADLDKIDISFAANPQTKRNETYLNGENVEDEIRGMAVSQNVSPVAAIPEVRRALVDRQRTIAASKSVVMDGRDIGTVVFPNADLKLFITASDEVRAQRRFDELTAKGETVNFNDILANVRERDRIDSTRAESPLRKADDAILIDNSNLTREEQFNKIMQLVRSKA